MKKLIRIASFGLAQFFVFTVIVLAQNGSGKNDLDSIIKKGEYTKAISLLNKIIENDSSDIDAMIKLGTVYQKKHQYNEAKEILYKAYEYNKFNLPLIMSLGRNYVYMGASSYSLLFFEQALELDPNSLMIKLELGQAYIDSYNYEKAIDVYKNLLEEDSTNSYYYKQLGFSYLKSGNDTEAINYYEKSFGLNNNDGSVATQLAGLYFKHDQLEQAFFITKRGLSNNYRNLVLNRLAAEIMFRMKKYRDAKPQYLALLSMGDTTSFNYQHLGFCNYFMATSNADSTADSVCTLLLTEAASCFSNAAKIDYKDALSNLYLGICYKELGYFEEAVTSINKAILIAVPNYITDAYSQLGNSYELMSNYPNAIDAYRKGLEYNSDSEQIYFQLAAIFDKYYKDKKVSLLYFKKYLSMTDTEDKPRSEYAKSRIDALTEYVHFHDKGDIKK